MLRESVLELKENRWANPSSQPLEVEVAVEIERGMVPVTDSHRLWNRCELVSHHIRNIVEGPTYLKK